MRPHFRQIRTKLGAAVDRYHHRLLPLQFPDYYSTNLMKKIKNGQGSDDVNEALCNHFKMKEEVDAQGECDNEHQLKQYIA